MTRRSGLTLVEVLVAIFVMGIGMIALLTLFPIGVLQMAQSIRQERCLRAAQAADTISVLPLGVDAQGNATSLRYDNTMMNNTAIGLPLQYGLDRTYFSQCSTKAPVGGNLAMPYADPYGPSYVVMVDPHGCVASQGLPANGRAWVGAHPPTAAGAATGALLRRPVSFANNVPKNIKQWFSLPDDIEFDNDPFPGSPAPGTPKIAGVNAGVNTIMRSTPFSWTYVLQRPRTGDSSIVNCTIVVFENRPLMLANLGITGQAQLQTAETAYSGFTGGTQTAAFNTTNNTITITTLAGVPAPNVRPGDWLYDGTIILPDNVHKFPEIMSAFYRVVAVDETAANTYRYEVQQTIRPMARDPQRSQHANTIIVMEGISEVFERGPVRVP